MSVSAIGVVQVMVVLAAAGHLIRILFHDFTNLKVTNRSVLILLGLYVVWAALGGFATSPTDLVAAGVLFGLGVVMWLMQVMGAGDAKLYFGVGLFVGFPYLMIYAFLLVLSSFGFFFVLVVARRANWADGLAGRLNEFGTSGRAPYAVPICLAAVPTILLRGLAGF